MEDDEKMELRCRMCKSDKVGQISEIPGYRKGSRFAVRHCVNCNSSSAHPLTETHEEIESLYEGIYRQAERLPGYERYVRYSRKVTKHRDPLRFLARKDEAYWAVEHLLKDKNPETHKVLEIGSGLGYLTYAIRQAGFDVIGLDISQEAVNAATERYGQLFVCGSAQAYTSTSSSRFDSIVMTEVVEHVEDVYGLLRSAQLLLNPAGSIMITSPNKSSYPAGSIWKTELPPVHHWWLSEESVVAVCERLSMKVEFTNFASCRSLNLTSVPTNKKAGAEIVSVLDCDGNYVEQSGFLGKLKLWMYRSGASETACRFIYRVPGLRNRFLVGERRVSFAARISEC